MRQFFFYYIEKDESSQSESIIELCVNENHSEWKHSRKTIFTSTNGSIVALERDFDNVNPEKQRIFVVDSLDNVIHLEQSDESEDMYLQIEKWNLFDVTAFKQETDWL